MYKHDICLICKQESPEPAHFWREHHLKEQSYCQQYHPRYSKATNKLIEFKSRDFYFAADFNNKVELKSFFKSNPNEALSVSLDIIKRRKDEGKITHAPSQVELKSLVAPNIIWYLSKCDYNEECEKLGLLKRFDYTPVELDFTLNKTKKLNLIQDTREQKGLTFKNHNVKVQKLNFGDYFCENSQWSHVYIERKSLSDFLGTLTAGLERFEREIQRAQKENAYLFILVEESIAAALSFNYQPHISRKIKASPEYVWQRVRKLIQKYDNIQIVFSGSRNNSEKLVETIYNYPTDPKLRDFQYLIDNKTVVL